MTVKKLKELLEQCNDDDVVVVSSDAEGNSYRKLSYVATDLYSYEGDYNVEIGLRQLTPSLEATGYSEEDLLEETEVPVWSYGRSSRIRYNNITI